MEKSGQVSSGGNNNKKNGREYFTLRELFDILYGKRKAKDSVPLFSEAGTMIEDIINEEIDNYFLKNTADPEELKRSESIGSNFNRYRAASEKLKQYQVKKHGEEQLGQFFFPQLTERYGDPYADLQRYKSGDPKEDINEGVRKRHYEGNETLGRHVARLLNPYTKISKAASLKALSEDRTYIGRELLKNNSLWNMKNHFMAVYFILKKSGYDKNEFNDKLLSFLDKTGYIGKIDLEKADGAYPGKDIKRVLERIRTLLNAGKDAFAFYDLLLLACFQDELTTELADNLLGFTEESPGTDNRAEFNKEGSPGWADEGIRPLSANPFCNTFIERPGLLNALEEGFIQHKLILLSGVTGEGKSETARAFVQSEERKRKEGKSARFHHFIWLSCPEESSPSGLDQLMKVNGRSLKNEPAALKKDVLYIADGLNTLGRGILSDLLEKTGEAGVLITSLKSFPEALVKTSPEKFLEIPVGENGIRKREFARQVFLAYFRGESSVIPDSGTIKPFADNICSFFGFHTFACAMAGTQAAALRDEQGIPDEYALEEMALNLSASKELSEAFPEDAVVSVWDKDSDEELSINIASRLNQLFSFYFKGNKLLSKEKKLLQLLILSSGVPVYKEFIGFILKTEPVFPNLRSYHLLEETNEGIRIHYLAAKAVDGLLMEPGESDDFYRKIFRRWLLVYRHPGWQRYRFLFLRIIRELGLLEDRDLTPEEWIFRLIVSETHPENLNNSICFAESFDKPCLIAMIQDEDSISFVSYTAYKIKDPDKADLVAYSARDDEYRVLFRTGTDRIPVDETCFLWKYWFFEEEELEYLMLPKAPDGIRSCGITSSIFKTVQIGILILKDNYDLEDIFLWSEKVEEIVLYENEEFYSIYDREEYYNFLEQSTESEGAENPDLDWRFLTSEEEELYLEKESEKTTKKSMTGNIDGFSAYLAEDGKIRLKLPENTSKIPERSFSIKSTGLIDTITSQNKWPFSGTLIIPDGIREIGAEAFDGQDGISGIKLPPSVKIIGPDAFAVTGLKGTVVLPETVKKIDITCFDYVDSMDTLIIECPDLIIDNDDPDINEMGLYPIGNPSLIIKTHYNSKTWDRLCELGYTPEPLPYE